MKQPTTARNTAESPANNHYAVTPHDTNEIGDFVPKGVRVGTGGTVVGRAVGAIADATFLNVQNGEYMPIQFQYIRSTGTTASDIVALY